MNHQALIQFPISQLFFHHCSVNAKDARRVIPPGVFGVIGIVCGERSALCRVGHIQHRAEGVEDEALDAVGHQQPLLLGEERHGNSLLEELALTGGQQRAAGAAGGCGAGRELGGVKGVAIAGQPAAGGGELGQRGVDTAALGLHGGQRVGGDLSDSHLEVAAMV